MHNLQKVAGLAFVVVIGSGCATMTRGTSESLIIETDPPGAEAALANGLRCSTPCSITVKRRGDLVVTIKKEGYEAFISTVTSSVDRDAAYVSVLGGILGAGVDAGTGAMHSHKPNPLSVKLQPIQHEERKDEDDS